jgi:hypothetical protein
MIHHRFNFVSMKGLYPVSNIWKRSSDEIPRIFRCHWKLSWSKQSNTVSRREFITWLIIHICFNRTPIFQQFSQTIKNCDADRDLSWWSDTYGATMKMNWPIFEVIWISIRIIDQCFYWIFLQPAFLFLASTISITTLTTS